MLFTIVTPVFNRGALLERTAQSVRAQTETDFEWIIVDDGSTDDTPRVLENLARKTPFIRVFRTENRERAAARNFGAAQAQGVYLTFLDSDDVLFPKHLSVARRYADGRAWFWLPYETQDAHGRRLKSAYIPPQSTATNALLDGNYLSCHGVFVQREVALERPFVEDKALSGSEDYVCWLQLAARYSLTITPEVTNALIQHDGRSVLSFSPEKIITRMELTRRYAYQDLAFRKTFGAPNPRLESYLHLYAALHLALAGRKADVPSYLLRALAENPASLARKTFWATVKRLLF